jgi:hypothetical protein
MLAHRRNHSLDGTRVSCTGLVTRASSGEGEECPTCTLLHQLAPQVLAQRRYQSLDGTCGYCLIVVFLASLRQPNKDHACTLLHSFAPSVLAHCRHQSPGVRNSIDVYVSTVLDVIMTFVIILDVVITFIIILVANAIVILRLEFRGNRILSWMHSEKESKYK